MVVEQFMVVYALAVGVLIGCGIGIALCVWDIRRRRKEILNRLKNHDDRDSAISYKPGAEIAAQCWCHPMTASTQFDIDLAVVFALKIAEYIDALRWCGGSPDFHLGGPAREGWDKIVEPLIRS